MLVPLAREQLDDRDPLQRFLEERVQCGQTSPRLPVGVPGAEPEVRGHRGQHRHDGERHQREPPVHPQHDGHHAHERDDVRGDGEQAARERLADRLHVIEHTGHQAAHRIAVVVGGLQTQQVSEERLAQVVRHALAHERHEIGLEAAQRIENAQRRRVCRGRQ